MVSYRVWAECSALTIDMTINIIGSTHIRIAWQIWIVKAKLSSTLMCIFTILKAKWTSSTLKCTISVSIRAIHFIKHCHLRWTASRTCICGIVYRITNRPFTICRSRTVYIHDIKLRHINTTFIRIRAINESKPSQKISSTYSIWYLYCTFRTFTAINKDICMLWNYEQSVSCVSTVYNRIYTKTIAA